MASNGAGIRTQAGIMVTASSASTASSQKGMFRPSGMGAGIVEIAKVVRHAADASNVHTTIKISDRRTADPALGRVRIIVGKCYSSHAVGGRPAWHLADPVFGRANSLSHLTRQYQTAARAIATDPRNEDCEQLAKFQCARAGTVFQSHRMLSSPRMPTWQNQEPDPASDLAKDDGEARRPTPTGAELDELPALFDPRKVIGNATEVLIHGLPKLPRPLSHLMAIPVAYWTAQHSAVVAVLRLNSWPAAPVGDLAHHLRADPDWVDRPSARSRFQFRRSHRPAAQHPACPWRGVPCVRRRRGGGARNPQVIPRPSGTALRHRPSSTSP